MRVNDFGVIEYFTQSNGVGGTYKTLPEDFVVQEINPQGEVSTIKYSLRERVNDLLFRFKKPRKYVRATLVKKDYNTMKCVKILQENLRTRIGYAGLKDKRAVTAQRISIPSKGFRPVKRKDFFIKNFEYNHSRIMTGNLSGNVFTVTIRNAGGGVDEFVSELRSKNMFVPNFFGEQRFGSYKNTHIVGLHLLKKEYVKACEEILKGKGLIEDSLKRNVSKGEVLALKKLGRMIEFYVHAAQSYIFNNALSNMFLERGVLKKLALPGLNVEIDSYTLKEMERLGIKREDFLNRELGFRVGGDYRKALMRVNDFRILKRNPLKLKFRLENGCFASIILNELLK